MTSTQTRVESELSKIQSFETKDIFYEIIGFPEAYLKGMKEREGMTREAHKKWSTDEFQGFIEFVASIPETICYHKEEADCLSNIEEYGEYIHEFGYYKYLCISKRMFGDKDVSYNSRWFELVGNDYEKCDQPECLKQICF